MVSAVSICNRALFHVGAKGRISSLTELRNAEADRCNEVYADALKETLEAYDWSFARCRVALAEHGDDPPDTWGYRYVMPANCAALRHLVNPLGDDEPPVPYDVELSEDRSAPTILTNLEDAVVRYTLHITDPSLFSSLFTSALSRLIASYIAFPLTGDLKIAEKNLDIYSKLVSSASASNASQHGQNEPADAPWISGRA